MSISVVRLEPGDQWDQNILDLLFTNRLHPTGLHFVEAELWPDTDGIVLVVPGRYWHRFTDDITASIARYSWVLAIRTSDEESLLDIGKIEHPNIRWWVQTPRDHRDYAAVRYLPLGFPPHFNDMAQHGPMDNLRIPTPNSAAINVFLSAQNTHTRRHQAFAALANIGDVGKKVRETQGFTEGMLPESYAAYMAAARVAPAPSGAVSPDSFRLYEALEAHAVPIADDISPTYPSQGYWRTLFPDAPFPILTDDYTSLRGYIDDVLADWPRTANRCSAWWMAQKRRIAHWVCEDVVALGADYTLVLPITVLVSVSPIKSHPDTRILDETIASVRRQLPDSEIILMFDGVRAEQEDRRADYEEFIRRTLWRADHHWRNVLPLIADEHLHQAFCTKRALAHVQSPLILFVEHDTPLTDGPIPWAAINASILRGHANVVRFSHEAQILPEHRYLMLDSEPRDIGGVPMTRTIQWSQRPHLASVAFYRDMLDRCFPTDEPNFIEDVVYGKLVEAHRADGEMGWYAWRTHIYTPDGNIQRSSHTDGREGAPKYDR